MAIEIHEITPVKACPALRRGSAAFCVASDNEFSLYDRHRYVETQYTVYLLGREKR
jgi:hypothetical protein